MNRNAVVSLSLSALLFAALHAAPARAGDIADITIEKQGTAHVLSVDLDTLGDGQTLQLSTQAGVPAIVSRSGGTLDVEIAGATHEISIGEVNGTWVDAHGGKHEVEVVRFEKGEADEGSDGRKVKVVRLHGEHDELIEERLEGADAGKVVVIKRHGDDAMDEDELVRLIEEAKAGSGPADADGVRITVERRVTREAVN
ncbi:hypothetical protein [Pseudomarimonas salicorniae]|uniref:DUF5666 domain-containing protein n=1 Tax=Pseudomarimonas salicorniae TaxID=2933270 RepID=A0ABT0GKI8_9GAMM|nr:hypothetical protein [Lysobacter sp. CAU 1642]MCK7595058.1 hypothetical protein [Lysobacter sp. CAU 1642]